MKRITPACAGKTILQIVGESDIEDHPRLRGENQQSFMKATAVLGSPPLARGKRTHIFFALFCVGITPACAGKTLKKA